MVRLAIFASGNGSNAQRIIEHFANHPKIKVEFIIYNIENAFVAERAKNLNVRAVYFGKKDFSEAGKVCSFLKDNGIDWIVLAGFLLLVPHDIIKVYHHRIINIHPALLPKYGGKGMYGRYVHEAVVANKESESGITVHLVDEQYDNGDVLFQARCQLSVDETADSLAQKVHELEYRHFPVVVENTIMQCV